MGKYSRQENECKREMTLLERQQHLVTILVQVVDACEQERKNDLGNSTDNLNVIQFN